MRGVRSVAGDAVPDAFVAESKFGVSEDHWESAVTAEEFLGFSHRLWCVSWFFFGALRPFDLPLAIPREADSEAHQAQRSCLMDELRRPAPHAAALRITENSEFHYGHGFSFAGFGCSPVSANRRVISRRSISPKYCHSRADVTGENPTMRIIFHLSRRVIAFHFSCALTSVLPAQPSYFHALSKCVIALDCFDSDDCPLFLAAILTFDHGFMVSCRRFRSINRVEKELFVMMAIADHGVEQNPVISVIAGAFFSFAAHFGSPAGVVAPESLAR
jgi:hypothetical protein